MKRENGRKTAVAGRNIAVMGNQKGPQCLRVKMDQRIGRLIRMSDEIGVVNANWEHEVMISFSQSHWRLVS